MKLSKNFTLQELTRTSHNVENIPNEDEIYNLTCLVQKVLQPIRDNFGSVTINSGYRSPVLNRKIGGSTTSQHCKGQAADIKLKDMRKVYDWIIDNLIFDQLIYEAGDDTSPAWIHISYKNSDNRKQTLRMKNGKYYPYEKST